jgi:hypothetical protein
MLTFTQVLRFTSCLFFATQIQCLDGVSPGQSVHEPIQGQKTSPQQATSPSPQDGAISVGDQGQGVHQKPSEPCRIDTQSGDQSGSKTKLDLPQMNTVEFGVQTDVPKGKSQWTPYVQHRCR